MERPQDLRRTLTEGGMWTTWLLATAESVKSVKSPKYLKNVYKQLHEDDELIIRIRNGDGENCRLHLIIKSIDLVKAEVETVVIHEIDLNTGEDIVVLEEAESNGS